MLGIEFPLLQRKSLCFALVSMFLLAACTTIPSPLVTPSAEFAASIMPEQPRATTTPALLPRVLSVMITSTLVPRLQAQLPTLTDTYTQVQSAGILWTPSKNSGEVWLLNPDTWEAHILVTTENYLNTVVWSPDRTRFAFADNRAVWVESLQEHKRIEVVNSEQPIGQVQWIGLDLIHYCTRNYGARFSRCFVYNLKIQSTVEGLSIPEWSDPLSPAARHVVEIAPDYRHAVFLLEGDPEYHLVDLTTGATSSIFTSSFEIPREGQIYGRWSHDGRQFAFVVTRFDSDLRGFDNHLYVVNANGSDLREVFNFNALLPNRRLGSPAELEWSPSDQWLSFIFTSDYGTLTPSTIHILRINDGKLIDLEAPIESTVSHPRWSPDGKHLIYVTENHGAPGYDLYMVDISSKHISRLTQDGYNKFHFDW